MVAVVVVSLAALVLLQVVAVAVVRGARRTRERREFDDREAGPAPDGRLRFVLFRPAGANFTIDAVVHDEGSGRLGEAGSAVTLRLHRPAAPREELALEVILREWADEDRLVDVTLGEDATITTLQADGSRTRLHLVS